MPKKVHRDDVKVVGERLDVTDVILGMATGTVQEDQRLFTVSSLNNAGRVMLASQVAYFGSEQFNPVRVSTHLRSREEIVNMKKKTEDCEVMRRLDQHSACVR